MFPLRFVFGTPRWIRYTTARGVPQPRRLISTNIPNQIPATFLRGGTSKGIFIHRDHLPRDRSEWAPIFLGIMGSPDTENGLQINGMGGGISSLSKICVVGPPSPAQKALGLDAEYTFCQVGIQDTTVDYSGNCGNLSSMVGPFALQEGICTRDTSDSSETTIRVFNTNTASHIHSTFPVVSVDGRVVPKLDLPQTSIAGVPGKASRITLEFPNPGGARTGKLLPTGNPVDIVSVDARPGSQIPVSLVDATNPTIFVTLADLTRILDIPPSKINYSDGRVREIVESIRQQSAIKMGLDPALPAQPKIAIISPPSADDHDIFIQAYSMGVPHKAVPMTVGLCLGVAANIKHSLVDKTARVPEKRMSPRGLLNMRHPSGFSKVGADFNSDGNIACATTVRTGRWLMKGAVYWTS